MATGDHEDAAQEPKVVFEPSPKLVAEVNEKGGSSVARAKSDESLRTAKGTGTSKRERPEEPTLHQYDESKAEYPGQPRVPERDEGPMVPPSLEEIEEAQAQSASVGETIRDRWAFHEAAAVYVYEGDERTTSPFGDLTPGQELDFRAVQDPNVLKVLKADAKNLQLKKK